MKQSLVEVIHISLPRRAGQSCGSVLHIDSVRGRVSAELIRVRGVARQEDVVDAESPTRDRRKNLCAIRCIAKEKRRTAGTIESSVVNNQHRAIQGATSVRLLNRHCYLNIGASERRVRQRRIALTVTSTQDVGSIGGSNLSLIVLDTTVSFTALRLSKRGRAAYSSGNTHRSQYTFTPRKMPFASGPVCAKHWPTGKGADAEQMIRDSTNRTNRHTRRSSERIRRDVGRSLNRNEFPIFIKRRVNYKVRSCTQKHVRYITARISTLSYAFPLCILIASSRQDQMVSRCTPLSTCMRMSSQSYMTRM